jgi:hypothetical protein
VVASVPAGTTKSDKYDTSVYPLLHARARQIIPAVRQALCKSLAVQAATDPTKPSIVSVIFMPTSADDALVAICPKEHASQVKEAIAACDVEKQYAVKLQLFEVSAEGKTIPVGEPALVIGREGIVQCKTAGESPVTLKLQISDAVAGGAIKASELTATEEHDPTCYGPDCGQPEAEASTEKAVCPAACSRQSAGQCTCPGVSDEAQASSSGECTAADAKCHACQGQCTASEALECPACHGQCVASCQGKCAAGCQTNACQANAGQAKSGGKCDTETVGATSEVFSEPCEKGAQSCNVTQSLTPEENQVLIRILVHDWMLEHQAHSGTSREVSAPAELGDHSPDCDSGATKNLIVPATSAEVPAEKSGVELGKPAPAPAAGEAPAETSYAVPCEEPPVPRVVLDAEGPSASPGSHTNDDGFRSGGVYRLGSGEKNDDVAVTRVSDTEESEAVHECGVTFPASAGEPPALLTLSARKDGTPSLGILISPQWQAELSKIYQGRRLSEIFEPHNGQDPGSAALGRLLAEIPKSVCEKDADAAHRHNVVVVDLPDRIRVFETKTEPAPVAAALPACPNCHEQFRAFLEEAFRGANLVDEVSQIGHTEFDATPARSPRELPSVTPSKLDTTVVTYPLRDLVLLDDSERPVFDTCTIIDHIELTVAPESWGHPSVSIQLDQQSMNLVIRQTPEVHKQVATYLRDLRRSQVKRLGNMLERLSTDAEPSED